MRSHFWCLTAVTVAAAAVFYRAAEHTAQYPDSPISRCTIGTYRLGTDYNPVYLVGQAACGRATHVARLLATACQCMTAPGCGPVAKFRQEPCGKHQPTLEELRSLHVMRFQKGDIQWDGVETCEEGVLTAEKDCGETCPGAAKCTKEGCPATAALVKDIGVSAVEESEDRCSKRMPHCHDEEKATQAINPLVEFWRSLFREVARQKKDGWEGQSDSSAEESEAGADHKSDCLEDPAYHHQYPGCPYTGDCPSGHCRPRMKHHETTPKADKQKDTFYPVKPQPQSKAWKFRSRKGLPNPVDLENMGDRPVHPEVDTMEFRPSDARKIPSNQYQLGPF